MSVIKKKILADFVLQHVNEGMAFGMPLLAGGEGCEHHPSCQHDVHPSQTAPHNSSTTDNVVSMMSSL
jgi:hypothetical protein